jgi:hypothetical protein
MKRWNDATTQIGRAIDAQKVRVSIVKESQARCCWIVKVREQGEYHSAETRGGW